MDFYAVIVAAGSGNRFQDDLPKQYHMLKNRAVLTYSLDAFSRVLPPENIVVCIHEGHKTPFNESVSPNFPKIQKVVGGATRSESVFKGLDFFSQKSIKGQNAKVLIHDGARPLILTPIIGKLVKSLNNGSNACTLVKKVSDTMCLIDERQKLGSYVPRDKTYAIQTPQGFDFDLLYEAHVNAREKDLGGHTDDTSLMYHFGTPIDLIENSTPNFKITTKQDLILAEAILNDRDPS